MYTCISVLAFAYMYCTCLQHSLSSAVLYEYCSSLQCTQKLAEQFKFGSSEQFVQILNVDNAYWVYASNIYCPPGVVDSILLYCVGSYNLHKQLAAIMKCSKKDIVLRFINVQRQAGEADCSVFSIAFAYSLCCGVDPHTMSIDQSLSHAYLLSCFLKCKFSAFPHASKPHCA